MAMRVPNWHSFVKEWFVPNSSLRGNSDPSCAKPAFGISKKQISRSRAISRSPDFSPFLKRYIHQQLIAFNVDDVAEGALTAAGEIEPHADAAHTHVANA